MTLRLATPRFAQSVSAIAGLGAAVVAAGCGEIRSACRNEIIRESVSPDGALKATLFDRECGPPTGFSSQVSITGSNETASEKGNVFIADTGDGLAVPSAWGGPDVTFEWTSPRALTLTVAAYARVIVQHESVRGVAITYQSGEPP